jgi:hypothetical protein
VITFIDGAAAGSRLDLRRAPIFLRVVIDRESGAADALDQPDDVCKDTETPYAYYRTTEAQEGVLCSRGKGCQRFVNAEYWSYPTPPDEATLRNNDAWRDWAIEEHQKLNPPKETNDDE